MSKVAMPRYKRMGPKRWYQYHVGRVQADAAASVKERFSTQSDRQNARVEAARTELQAAIGRQGFWRRMFGPESDEVMAARYRLQAEQAALYAIFDEMSAATGERIKFAMADFHQRREEKAQEAIDQKIRKRERYLERSPALRANQRSMKYIVIARDDPDGSGFVSCFYCGKAISILSTHLDHKTPIVRGGTNKKENLVLACDPCNLRKGQKTAAEFMRTLHEV